MRRQPGRAGGSSAEDVGGGKVLMRQDRILAFRFLILKVGTMTFPFRTVLL